MGGRGSVVDVVTCPDNSNHAPTGVRSAVQPIVRLSDGAIVGWEALARFIGSEHPPDHWLAQAELAGTRLDLELLCLEAAARCGAPPDDALLFVNAGPVALLDTRFDEIRRRLPDRLVVELTEQAAVDDYDLLRARMQRISADGVHLAIDDAGAGYSSLRHVLELSPEFLKLDRSLVHGVDHDRKLQALVHSIVAFAREVGATVVAEGVEQRAELDVLHQAGVHLAQGFLLGRPAAPWPEVDRSLGRRRAPTASTDGDDDGLAAALERAPDARTACDVVCNHLHRRGELLPSIYLVRGGLLRCQAQRGYWQILDGFPPEVGMLGRSFRSGERIVVDEVHRVDGFMAAAPGLASEVVVPLRVDGRVVGVFSVESVSTIPADAIRAMDRAARLLEARLEQVETLVTDGPLARLARSSQRLAGLVEGAELRTAIVLTACEVATMSSALLAERQDDGSLLTTAATGPLAAILVSLDGEELAQLASHVQEVTSCYTADDPTGRTPTGSERLRGVGAASVAILPLGTPGRRTGILVVADDRARHLSTDDIEALELLGAEAARCLELAATVEELRNRAATDPLTRLGNHSAFYDALDGAAASGRPFTVLLADIDRFKAVNDGHGHLVGDHLLRDVAAHMASAVGPGGRLYRVGGDEFAALLLDPAAGAAAAITQRMWVAAGAELGRYGASLSIGAAAHQEGEAATSTVDRADQALYRAKRSGTGHAVG